MRTAIILSGLAALLPVLALLHLCGGARPLPPATVWAALTDYDAANFLHLVVIKQRLSRLAVALAVGGCLAAAGYLLQKVLRNDLVSPSTLGVNSGATAFAVAAIHFGGLSGSALFWPSLAGAAAGLLLAGVAAELLGRGSRDPLNLVLGGAMSATLFSAASAFILSLDPDAFGNILSWLVGDIGIFDYQTLQTLWPAALAALLVLGLLTRRLDLLALGEDQAASLGADPRLMQRIAIAGSVVLAVIAVTVAGPIGFVGLVVPHIARLWLGDAGLAPLGGALLLGAALLTTADLLARTLLAPRLLNVGTVMALFGGMAFLALVVITLRRRST